MMVPPSQASTTSVVTRPKVDRPAPSPGGATPAGRNGAEAPNRPRQGEADDSSAAFECTPAHWVVLWSLTIVGAILRGRGLTTGGLWTSDAWVALSSHVGLGTAWHMWANAPGFDLFERSWLALHVGASWWGQVPPLLMGVAAIPATFLLARYFRFPAWTCLAVTLVVSVSPVCIVYATRYKEYSADFLLACLLLALAERARRQPTRRAFYLLSAASVAGVAVSASVLPVVVGTWLAVGALVGQQRQRLAPMFLPAVLAGTGCLAISGVFYRHLSPYLHQYWRSDFFDYSSPWAFVDKAANLTFDVSAGLMGAPRGSLIWFFATLAALGVLAILGLLRGRAMVSPMLVLGAAFIACAVGTIPLGTGRADEVLYPAILLLIAGGLERLHVLVTRRGRSVDRGRLLLRAGAVVVIGALVLVGLGTDPEYHSVDIRALATAIDRSAEPGAHIVVDPFLRYSWALYEDPQPRVVLGTDWVTGFTVASPQRNVFIVPSFSFEGGYEPATWLHDLSNYRRIWLVDVSPLSASGLYGEFQRAGWRTQAVIHASGCEAVLLERSP